MGIISSLTKKVAKVGLAVPVAVGNLITTGIEKVTGKTYDKRTLDEAASTTTGKILGTAITAGAAFVAGSAIAASPTATAAISKTAQAVSKTISSSPTLKTGLLTAGTIAAFAPETTKQIISTPEGTKTAVATIINPMAGLVVGLEQGTSYLKSAVDANYPELENKTKSIIDKAKDIAPKVGAAVAVAAPVVISTLLPDKTEEKPKAQTPDVSTLPVDKITAIPATTQPNTAVTSPVLPETQILKATTGTASAKRKKSRSKALQSKISQSVRVNILNHNSAHRITKRYLNVAGIRNV